MIIPNQSGIIAPDCDILLTGGGAPLICGGTGPTMYFSLTDLGGADSDIYEVGQDIEDTSGAPEYKWDLPGDDSGKIVEMCPTTWTQTYDPEYKIRFGFDQPVNEMIIAWENRYYYPNPSTSAITFINLYSQTNTTEDGIGTYLIKVIYIMYYKRSDFPFTMWNSNDLIITQIERAVNLTSGGSPILTLDNCQNCGRGFLPQDPNTYYCGDTTYLPTADNFRMHSLQNNGYQDCDNIRFAWSEGRGWPNGTPV